MLSTLTAPKAVPSWQGLGLLTVLAAELHVASVSGGTNWLQ